jgi:diaminopimelate decarboxylase
MTNLQLPKSVACEAVHKPLKLTARISDEIDLFLATPKPYELVQALGSPLNILFPQRLRENIDGFQSIFNKHNLTGRIYFAHKANRSDCVPRYLATTDAFIDVSSTNELRHALGSGFEPFRIQATGPKNTEFLCLCLQQHILLSIDSLEELQQVIQLSAKFRKKSATNVLLRVAGFKNRQLNTRAKPADLVSNMMTSVRPWTYWKIAERGLN